MLALTFAATVQIGVFGSFHPTQLEVWPSEGTILVVETLGRKETLTSGHSLRISGPARVAGHAGAFVRFHVALPPSAGLLNGNRIEREYYGRLEVRAQDHHLVPIVEMDRETAVASIVESEGTAGIPFEARKAQAVVSRSYLIGAHGKRHSSFDYCDEAHCQFMRSTPAERSDAYLATMATRGQVLTFHGDVLAALYSANCGGHTRTLSEAGWQNVSWKSQDRYPFHSVSCPLQTGKVSGHGVGMCQLGAIEIAKRGIRASVILHHYFPDTMIETLPAIQERLSKQPVQMAKRKFAPKPAGTAVLGKNMPAKTAPNRVVVVAAVSTDAVNADRDVRAGQ